MNTLDSLSFCPELVDLVERKEVRGRSGKLMAPLGVSTVNNLIVLRNLLLDLKPKRTMEIGLAYGGSGLVFAATHRELGHGPSRQHTAIDPFQHDDYDDCGLLTLERAGLLGYVSFYGDFSSVALPQMVQQGLRFDFVYVDGSHLFEDVFVDYYYVSRLLDEGGIVAFDDCSWPHVRKVVRFIRSNASSAYREVDVGPYREDRGRSLKFRLARLTGRIQLTVFKKIGPIQRPCNAPFSNF